MRRTLTISVDYDDEKFGQRPLDIQHAVITGIRDQYGTDEDSGIVVTLEHFE